MPIIFESVGHRRRK